ncbi:hypothetical protein N7492_001136 [Penicillium capsulatum]|uniref:D-isomer specific 2-hydroxyacid dehydrogenase NAD-binding domain-containing protein n=1 Tax=Penicillium capsulatum TaxID=69766 RepID=A0A9W9LZM2_9EURO|nr:hypothetical protein N7492_001136 [Penicillium capsulatum]KAJ6129808.1 hypothetical protein N7512_002588 [Penicillium capsulatum]
MQLAHPELPARLVRLPRGFTSEIMTETIVALDTCFCAIPPFRFPHLLYEYTSTSQAQTTARLGDATIMVTDSLICVSIVGVDHIDLPACRERGIRVCNTPGATTEAVAEHAIALYFSAGRNIVRARNWVMRGTEWARVPSGMEPFDRLPIPCSQDKMGIIGHGKIGQKIAVFARALGMAVLIADRRGVSHPHIRQGRTAFEDVLQQATAIVLTYPWDESTTGMIAEKELGLMQPQSILINVGRGGLVNERDLIAALESRKIAGYTADVLAAEPATKQNSLLLSSAAPNLTLSPDIAWYNGTSIECVSIQSIVEGFVAGQEMNVVC